MGKSLLDKIRTGWRTTKLIVAAAGAIGLAGCTEQCTPNVPPIAEFNVAPNSGYKPLQIYIDLTGTDSNGQADIIEYKIGIDKNDNNRIDADEVITSSDSPIADYSIILDTIGNKKILGEVTDTQGAFDKRSVNVVVSDPPIEDYLDIEGYFKILDTESPGEAEIKIFNSTTPKTLITQVEVNPSTGYFSLHSTTQKVSELSGITIEAAAKEDGVWKSYIVRENFPAGDVIIPKPIMAKLFPDYCTPSEFKTFMNQTAISSLYGLARFDLENAEGIEILLKNCDPTKNYDIPENPDVGWEYITDLQELKTKELNYIANHFGGTIVGDNLYLSVNGQEKIIPIIIETSPNSQDHYTVGSNLIFPNVGWITFVPDAKCAGVGRANFFCDFDHSRVLLKRARIDLSVVNEVVPLHETLHVYQGFNTEYEGDCDIPPFYYVYPGVNNLTILTPNNLSLISPGIADIDSRKIVYNYNYSPGKDIDEILGQIFSDGESVY